MKRTDELVPGDVVLVDGSPRTVQSSGPYGDVTVDHDVWSVLFEPPPAVVTGRWATPGEKWHEPEAPPFDPLTGAPRGHNLRLPHIPGRRWDCTECQSQVFQEQAALKDPS